MKRDCNTCVYKEGSCYPSTMIFDKDKTCKSYVPDYEDYIAELEKENAELRTKTTALENANRAMIKELDEMTSGGVSVLENVVRSKEQLAKAKEIIEELYNIIPASMADYAKEPMEHARKFLTEEADE